MKVDGQCHCGDIRFEADVDPKTLRICHCTDCQRISGSAFRANIAAPAEHFKLLSGEPKSYIKVAESGAKRRHTFCGNCGTPIFACAVENPPHYSLRSGAINQRHAFEPYLQIWHKSALGWVDRIGQLPASEKQEGAKI